MVDSAYAEWLQKPERIIPREDAALAARWGDRGESVSTSCALDYEADAIAEADRQLAFKGGPLVEDAVIVSKLLDLAVYRGRVWTITILADDIYGGGIDVFVTGGEVLQATGLTTLYVLRRL